VQHFAVIQSLCRLGLQTRDPAIRQQVERLRDRLLKDGNGKDAETLTRLLGGSPSADMTPTRVELSRFHIQGQLLTDAVPAPVDRETSQPLCRVVLDARRSLERPLLPNRTAKAVADLTEEWSSYERLDRFGVAPARSCLLFGPPGTGKTLTAYHIASVLRLPLIDARIDGLISSFLGTTARNIANLFAFANRYRCILLLDEFDAVAKLRDDPQEVGEIKRVVNSLLQNLDERAEIGITIAITNHDKLLDSAVWRRFEHQVEFGLPDRAVREQLFAQFLKPMPTNQTLHQFAAYVSEGRSGSDIQRLCNAVKRSLAIARSDPTPSNQFMALRECLAREPMSRAQEREGRLIESVEEFVTEAFSDPAFGIKQKPLSALMQVDQSTLSRWAKKTYTKGAAHAQ
jgi:ATPase family associated with various cellular activities (AAA)